MKRLLLKLALFAALVTLCAWGLLGASRGWTKTSVPVKSIDAITGIESVTYQKQFVPGLDFLAAGLGIAGLLAGASLLLKTKQDLNHNRSETEPT